MSSVTIPLLDSMLRPSPGQPAEAVYRSIPLPNRVRELTAILRQLHGGGGDDAGRSMLAAVLLRREISTLAASSDLSLLGEVAEPLMALFTQDGAGDKQGQQSRRQIGHCIAELCSSLSVASPANGREWMKSVLGRLEPGVSPINYVSPSLLFHLMTLVPDVLPDDLTSDCSASPWTQCTYAS